MLENKNVEFIQNCYAEKIIKTESDNKKLFLKLIMNFSKLMVKDYPMCKHNRKL